MHPVLQSCIVAIQCRKNLQTKKCRGIQHNKQDRQNRQPDATRVLGKWNGAKAEQWKREDEQNQQLQRREPRKKRQQKMMKEPKKKRKKQKQMLQQKSKQKLMDSMGQQE